MSQRFQAPKGTRDFFPADMAVRRHLEGIWRGVAVRHGFEEIDGPTFEHLELYTVKSGDEIVSELFSFRRAGGDTDYALRPEFTPTLARMVAARGGQLPKPIRWFSIAPMFRAERPQRGRLREHYQWNVDVLGDPTPRAEAEIVAAAADALGRMGLEPGHVRIKLSHRDVVAQLLQRLGGIDPDALVPALALLDRRFKIPAEEFRSRAAALGIAPAALDAYDAVAGSVRPADRLLGSPIDLLGPTIGPALAGDPVLAHLAELGARLERLGLLPWCEVDLGIVRGLAYYTGTVFEVHEARGAERAVAGGGRYDRLVELFGGAPTPAMGFAMGDVVIRLVLEDLGRLGAAETYLPRPDAFILDLRGDEAAVDRLLARLRGAGLHARAATRASTNLGKLLGDAAKARARAAVILDKSLDADAVALKDLDRGTQETVALAELEAALRAIAGA